MTREYTDIEENKLLICIVTGLRWLDLTSVRLAGFLLDFCLLWSFFSVTREIAKLWFVTW